MKGAWLIWLRVIDALNKFKHKWNNYNNNTKGFEKWEHCMQKLLYEYFNLRGDLVFLNDVSVKLIDKTDPKNPTKREDYGIHTPKSSTTEA